MSKYLGLRDHLMRQRLVRVRMRFREIEEVLGVPLPKSARLYPAWWANQEPPSSQSRAWIEAGWLTEDVDLASGRVTFVKVLGQSPAATPAMPGKRAASGHARAAPAAAPAETSPSPAAAPAQSRCAVVFAWTPLTDIVRHEDGRLSARVGTSAPALYRFRLVGAGGERRYVGEAENLARRIYMYCNPGQTRMTNLRLNEVFSQHLHFGGRIHLDAVLDGARVELDGVAREIDMAGKFDRRCLENAAILLELRDKSLLLNA